MSHDRNAQAIHHVLPLAKRHGERTEVDELSHGVFGKRLREISRVPARFERRRQLGRVAVQVEVGSIFLAVIEHAVKRLVLAHSAAQEDLEYVLDPQIFRDGR